MKKTSNPVLQIKQLTVESTNLYVPFLDVRAGDRIGISGRSGIGKSQLLRACARLDPSSPDHNISNTMILEGKSCDEISPTHWRSEVMWVPQDRPAISGTPRDFFDEILNYRSQLRKTKKKEHKTEPRLQTPMEIAQDWNLPAKTWDQPWNDVSGGEAQRLSLAIALSLRPKILLLDDYLFLFYI